MQRFKNRDYYIESIIFEIQTWLLGILCTYIIITTEDKTTQFISGFIFFIALIYSIFRYIKNG